MAKPSHPILSVVPPGTGRATVSAVPSHAELRDDFDRAHDVSVELREFLRRDPQFPVDRRPDGVNRVTPQELGIYVEPGHEARPTVLDVPVAGNLNRVLRD